MKSVLEISLTFVKLGWESLLPDQVCEVMTRKDFRNLLMMKNGLNVLSFTETSWTMTQRSNKVKLWECFLLCNQKKSSKLWLKDIHHGFAWRKLWLHTETPETQKLSEMESRSRGQVWRISNESPFVIDRDEGSRGSCHTLCAEEAFQDWVWMSWRNAQDQQRKWQVSEVKEIKDDEVKFFVKTQSRNDWKWIHLCRRPTAVMSTVNEGYKHPRILPKKHHVVELLVIHYHELMGHSGQEHVLPLAISRNAWSRNSVYFRHGGLWKMSWETSSNKTGWLTASCGALTNLRKLAVNSCKCE